MSRVWRCQSCNGNCDKGHGRGNAAGRKRGERGEVSGWEELCLFFSPKWIFLNFCRNCKSHQIQGLRILFESLAQLWWSTSICIPLAREPGFLPFLNLISSQLYFPAPRPKRGSFFTKMMKILHQQSVHVSCPDGSDIESF